MLEEIKNGYIPNIVELAYLISHVNENELFSDANELTKKQFGNVVKIRGIIEFSNYCKKQCAYCGINCENHKIKRYRMSEQEIVELALESAKYYETIILQSGEDNYYTADVLCDIIKEITKNKNIVITLSIGERNIDDYRRFKQAGAERFLLKHETADEDLYFALHKEPLSKRINCLENLKKLGFEVGGGFMIGLPGQSDTTLAKDLLLLKKIDVDMAGIGPFIAHEDTKLKGEGDGETQKTLKILALARLLLPKCNLPSTTALNVKGGLKNALNCGANVIMQKTTPYKYRKLYDIYPKKLGAEVTIKMQRDALQKELNAMGLRGE